MPHSYGATHVTTQPIALGDDVLASVGKLMRAFAEIEEILSLFICALAKLNQSQSVILLGRAPLSKKLAMAEQLAAIAGGQHLARYSACFDIAEFKDAHTCRNIMAHGILLGLDSEGMLAFLTDKTDAPEGPSAIQLVASYSPATIAGWANWAANNIEPIASALGLRSWLKRHQPQALLPHRKGRLPKGSGGKQARPPQPSQG